MSGDRSPPSTPNCNGSRRGTALSAGPFESRSYQALLIIEPSVSMLFVQKDNGILLVKVSNSGQPASLAENEEQQLAQLAVRKMKQGPTGL